MSNKPSEIELTAVTQQHKFMELSVDKDIISKFTFEKLPNEINNYQEVISSTIKALKDLHADIEEINHKIEETQTLFEDAQKKANSSIRSLAGGRRIKLSDDEQKYKSKIEELEHQKNDKLETILAQNANLEYSINFLNALFERKITLAETTILEKTDHILGLESTNQQQTQELLKKQSLISIQEKGFQDRDDLISTQNLSMTSIKDLLNESKAQVTTQSSQIDDTKKMIEAYQTTKNNLQSQLEELGTRFNQTTTEALNAKKSFIDEAKVTYVASFKNIQETFQSTLEKIEEEYKQNISPPDGNPVSLDVLMQAKEKADEALNKLNLQTQRDLSEAKKTFSTALSQASTDCNQAISSAKYTYQDAISSLNPKIEENEQKLFNISNVSKEMISPTALQSKTLEKIDEAIQLHTESLQDMNSLIENTQKDIEILSMLSKVREYVAFQQIELQQAIINQLKTESESLKKSLSSTQTSLSSAEENLEKKEHLIQQLNISNSELKDKIVYKNEQLRNLESKLHDSNQTISQLKNQLSDLQKENSTLTTQVESQRKMQQEQSKQLSLLTQKLNIAIELVTYYKNQNQELQNKIDDLSTKNSSLQAKHQEYEQKIIQLNTELTSLQNTISRSDPSIFSGSAELLRQTLNEEQKTTHDELLKNPTPENLLTIVKQVKFNEDEINQLKENVLLETLLTAANTSKELDTLREENTQIQIKISKNNEAIDGYTQNIALTNNQIKNIQAENQTLTEKQKTLEVDQAQLLRSIQVNQNKLTLQENTFEEYKQSLESQKSEYNDLQTEFNEQNRRIVVLDMAFVAQMQETEKLQEQLTAQKISNQTLQNTLTEKGNEIKSLTNEKTKMENNISSLRDNNVRLQTQLLEAQNQVNNAKNLLGQLIPQYDELKNEEKTLLNQVKELETEKAQLEKEEPQNKAKIDEINENINGLDNSIFYNRIQYESIAENIKSAQEKIPHLTNIENFLSQQIDNKYEQLSALEEKLRSTTDTLETLRRELDVAKTENTNLTSNVADLQKQIDTLTSKNQEQEAMIQEMRSLATLDALAKKWNMNLFNVTLNQNAPSQAPQSNGTANIDNPELEKEVYNSGTQLKHKESGLSYTFKIDPTSKSPQAILGEMSNTIEDPNLKNTAACVTNMIDNILANGNTIHIKTENPVVAAISEQYLEYLQKEKGVLFDSQISGPSSPIENLDLKNLIPEKFGENNNTEIIETMKKNAPPEPAHRLSKPTLSANTHPTAQENAAAPEDEKHQSLKRS